MPIYAYRCTACGLEKDVLQKMSDATLTTCPQCHAETLAKQLTAAGFQLKGSGWYATDFKDSGKPAADKPAGDKAEAKPETKTETKTDAATPACAGSPAACPACN